MNKRTSMILDEILLSKLYKIQSESILKTNSSVSISAIINQIILDWIIIKSPNASRIITEAIEDTLSKISEKTMKSIGRKLYEKHQTYFANYYENPSHLIDVLHEEFGNSHKAIIKEIDKKIKQGLCVNKQ